MIQLEKTYQKELIPGLRVRVDRTVESRLHAMRRSSFGDSFDARKVQYEYEQWTNEEVYRACPFHSFLETYPGPGDFKALRDFMLELDRRTTTKGMNEWTSNIIKTITMKLYPKSGPTAHLLP